MPIATLFLNPLHLPASATLWLVIPLCAAVAIVYKTLRVIHVRQLPREAGALIVYITAGLIVVGAGLWALQNYWPR